MDGYRLMARRDGTSVRLLTRNGNNWSVLFPAVAGPLTSFAAHSYYRNLSSHHVTQMNPKATVRIAMLAIKRYVRDRRSRNLASSAR
jgi:hypothetical protein